MTTVSSGRGLGGSLARAAVLATLAVVGLLALAPRAGADVLFWDNYSTTPPSIGFAAIDGSGGGTLNLGGVEIESPEGIAYDTVTNRLFVAHEVSGGKGEITFVNLDGGGAGPFTAPGAPIEEPEGVAVDPIARMIYWYNTESATVSWARLDGSAGGTLNTTGATNEGVDRIAVDPVAGRVYWGNSNSTPLSISYANVDNSGGGNLDLTGATPPEEFSGISVDPAAGRVYWIDRGGERVSFASLAGGGGGDVNIAGAVFNVPYGLALDPSIGRLYWGNYDNKEERVGAIGFASIAGGAGGISIQTAPLGGPQDPLVIKDPSLVSGPRLSRSANSRQWLSCSQGEWGEDYPGSFVYQAPRGYAYVWTRNGQVIEGATSASLKATAQGKYWCFVTATNQSGSTTAETSPLKVNPAKLKVLVKTKKKKAKKTTKATFKLQYYNQGDLKSTKPRVCAIVPKQLRRYLKAPKCKKLGKIKGKGRRGAKLEVYVKPAAVAGKSYKLKFVVKGVPSKPGYGRVKVVG